MGRRKWVSLVHRFETIDGKHHVNWKEPRKKTQTRSFGRMPDAQSFATNKTRKLGLKTYLTDTPNGIKNIEVSKKKTKRRTGFSIF